MSGHQNFERLVADWAGEVIRFYAETDSEPDDDLRQFVQIFLFGFGEITDSLDALRLSESLLKVAKPRSKKISPDLYIRYIVNSYLQEMYILKKRLLSYRTRLVRFYRRLHWAAEFEHETKALPHLISDGFSNIIETRGRHVHQKRYTDKYLDITSQITFVAKFDDSFSESANDEYELSKMLWHAHIKQNNETLKRILDSYFSAIHKGVTQDEKLVWPNKGFNADAGKVGAS